MDDKPLRGKNLCLVIQTLLNAGAGFCTDTEWVLYGRKCNAKDAFREADRLAKLEGQTINMPENWRFKG